MTDIKIIKDLLYTIEEITYLGGKFPLRAFPKLTSHLEKMKVVLEENNDMMLLKQIKGIEDFVAKYHKDFEESDDRAISRAFKRLEKANPDRLEDYRSGIPMMEYYEGIGGIK